MGYRWQNVKIEVNEDGTVDVSVEGRGNVLPHLDRQTLEPGDSVRIHTEIHFGDSLADQPTYEEYKGLNKEAEYSSPNDERE